MRKRNALIWLGAFASLSLSLPLFAVTWDGGGANANWSTANNWNPDGAPAAGSQLLFPPGALKLSNTNDYAIDSDFQSLQLSAANYTLGGNDLRLSNGILASHASGTNVINLGISLTQNQSFTVQNAGAFLTVNGDLDIGANNLSLGGLGNTVLGGRVSGTGALIKNGTGFLRLLEDNTYSGGTTVNGGTLDIKNSVGSATGNGAVIVENGAELQGNGEIGGEVLIKSGGKLSPGDDQPGVLATDNLILDANSVLVIQINGDTLGAEYSALQVNGSVILDQSIFRIALGPDVNAGHSFTVIDNDSNDQVTGTFSGLPQNETFRLVGIDDVGFKIDYHGGDGNDVVISSIPTLSIEDQSIAEPQSGSADATFVVTLTEPSSETITVKYATAAGSALAGDDYSVSNGTLSFAPGITSQNIVVSIKSDSVDEGDEDFSVKLFSPTNASIADNLATGTITPPGSQPGNGNGGSGGSGSGNFPTPGADSGGCSLAQNLSTGTPWTWMAGLALAAIAALRGFNSSAKE